MTEGHLGRLLPASLHQAIADELPQRLDFYENWLHSEGLRDGSIGMAPMMAVVGFLRTEGAAYERVMTRAGALAADWTLASLAPVRRRSIEWMPRWLRARAVLRLVVQMAQSISPASRVSFQLRGLTARLEVKASVFCSVRGVQPAPLCGFYLALIVRTLAHFGIGSVARVERCHAMNAPTCVLVLDLKAAQSEPDPAVAA
jgi:hypothetical protein